MTSNGPFIIRHKVAIGWAGLVVLLLAALLLVLPKNPSLPYHDSFSKGSANEWTPQGGIWAINDGVIYNRSDERVSKLISGSSDWKDYQLDTDMKYIGHEGDVGVIVRVGVDERGYDNYNGYFVGLRSEDSALIIARSDHGWMEGQPAPVTGGVQIGKWYHLHVVVVGCQVGAEVVNLETSQTSWTAFRDQHCFSKGKVGLRADASGGAWRNLSVTSATEGDWQAIQKRASIVTEPNFPGSEADFNRMREKYFKDTYDPVPTYSDPQSSSNASSTPNADIPQIASIHSARTPQTDNQNIIVRGVVTLASPLFIQDSSGGIAVEGAKSIELNLGDEVEISGRSFVNGFAPALAADNIRLLSDRTLVAPVSVSSSQAAGGAFDASLIEVSGILESRSAGPGDELRLRLYDSAQTFTVIVRSSLSAEAYKQWIPGSTLRIRGICTVPSSPADKGSAFTILTRAVNDVQVLAGPPWWTGWRLVRLLCLALLLICGGVYLYIRLARWKMNVILSERERLAHDLHDTLAQSFAGIGFHLQGLYNGLRSGSTPQAETVEMLQGACDMVAESHREASACIGALHPDSNDGQDFLVALERSTNEMLHSRQIKITLPLSFVREGLQQPISIPVRDALFHIGREAITNMIRHARATHMEIKLCYETRNVVMEVRDDGVGFPADGAAGGLGVRGMRSRAAKVGAQISITSESGGGTLVAIRAPYGKRPTLINWLRSIVHRIQA